MKEVAYLTPFERIAIAKGIEEGIEKGEQTGMLREARKLVLDALDVKFNMIPENVQAKLQEIQEEEVLRKLLRQVIKAPSLEEFSNSL